jgi:hypothetical protein
MWVRAVMGSCVLSLSGCCTVAGAGLGALVDTQIDYREPRPIGRLEKGDEVALTLKGGDVTRGTVEGMRGPTFEDQRGYILTSNGTDEGLTRTPMDQVETAAVEHSPKGYIVGAGIGAAVDVVLVILIVSTNGMAEMDMR